MRFTVKRKILTPALSFLLLFSACSTQIDNETEHDDTGGEEPIVSFDGTELIYAVPSSYSVSEDVSLHLNSYLQQLGKPYYITFTNIDEAGESGSSYIDELKLLIDSGQADLLYTGLPWSNVSVSGYDELAKGGCLYDLSDYISSEDGKALYDSVPVHFWQLAERNGGIYGVNGYAYTRVSPPSYMINKRLMEKYNLTEADFDRSLTELEDIFRQVKEGEGESFCPFTVSFESQISSAYEITDAIVINRSANKAELLSENSDYMSFVKDIYELQGLGLYAAQSERNIDDFLLMFRFSTPLPEELIEMGSYTTDGRTAASDDVVIISLDRYGWYRNEYSSYTSVSSTSENVEYALDFLKLIFTDKTVTDHLLFGIEDDDYQLEGGKISEASFYSEGGSDMSRWLVYGNSFICTPRFFEFENKREVYFDMQNELQADPLYGFAPDMSEYEAVISDTSSALNLISKMLTDSSYDEMKAAIDEAMKDAGADELLAETDRQLAEYLGENNE